MTAADDSDTPGTYASPPCFMHELGPDGRPVATADGSQISRDLSRWRKATRERLIAERLALPAETRQQISERIAHRLDAALHPLAEHTIGLYWPFRGEPDLRPWIKTLVSHGARAALPAVITKGQPLEFRLWQPGDPLEKGVWNIPVPTQGAIVAPDVIVAPLVGFDAAGYRLGYGGGFYDRTLRAMPHTPKIIGVGYEISRLPTIYPQWHDVPMDALIVEG